MPNQGEPVQRGATLGIVGGGQLGRMFVQAAQALGYKVCVLDPDPGCPAGAVADTLIHADYTDPAALNAMASLCPAVSTEFENVPAQALDALEALGVFVAPASRCVSIAQDRIAEKCFLDAWRAETNIGPAPYLGIVQPADLERAPAALFPGILKTARLGYDGKGQITVHRAGELAAAWAALGSVPCVLERRLDLDFEVSALVVRGHDDEVVSYPVAQNIHRNGVLHTSTVPAPALQPAQAALIVGAATALIRKIDYVGVLCVEFFVLIDGAVVVNEIAPRPHNSGHYTMDACETSQFEQQVRALARLPLGDPRLLTPVSMLNLLGDVWFDATGAEPTEPRWATVSAQPGARLHLYGKALARPGRKMGHINCMGESVLEAQTRCAAVAQALGVEP